MLMPKTSMHENHSTMLLKDDVGTAGQSPVVQPKAEPESVQKSTSNYLRLSIFAADRPHVAASLSEGKIIGHGEEVVTSRSWPMLLVHVSIRAKKKAREKDRWIESRRSGRARA
jgi:hypothetical protein